MCVLDIEIEGVKQVRASDLNPILVFVMPPSIDELKRRLIERKTETPESLKKRLDTAHREIEYGETLRLDIQPIDSFAKNLLISHHSQAKPRATSMWSF